MKRPPMFLHLFHGRQDPTEELDDWGSDGPVLKIEGFHSTYLNVLHIGVPTANPINEDWIDLDTRDGLTYYDGVWYGDFSIFAPGTDPDLEARAIDIIAEATVPPANTPVPVEQSWNPEDAS